MPGTNEQRFWFSWYWVLPQALGFLKTSWVFSNWARFGNHESQWHTSLFSVRLLIHYNHTFASTINRDVSCWAYKTVVVNFMCHLGLATLPRYLLKHYSRYFIHHFLCESFPDSSLLVHVRGMSHVFSWYFVFRSSLVPIILYYSLMFTCLSILRDYIFHKSRKRDF